MKAVASRAIVKKKSLQNSLKKPLKKSLQNSLKIYLKKCLKNYLRLQD